MYFKTFAFKNMLNKKGYSLMSIKKETFLQNVSKHEEIFTKEVKKNFYNKRSKKCLIIIV